MTPTDPGPLHIVQIAPEISPGSGVAGVAYELERALTAAGAHGCLQQPVVDVQVSDQCVVVADRDGIRTGGEERLRATCAGPREPHHVPRVPQP